MRSNGAVFRTSWSEGVVTVEAEPAPAGEWKVLLVGVSGAAPAET
jgi:hypothetical protein